jgi:hypothetical protein
MSCVKLKYEDVIDLVHRPEFAGGAEEQDEKKHQEVAGVDLQSGKAEAVVFIKRSLTCIK